MAVGICHEEISVKTQANIWYELGVAQASHYEIVADQPERNPVLAIDYLKHAFLMNGDASLQKKAKALARAAGLEFRAKNSVEALAAAF